jgi:probable HAF family extracellular repeat protein
MNKTFSKAVLTTVFYFASLSASAEYTFTLLGTLGGTQNQAYGINSSDQVVGWASTAGDSMSYATLWSGGIVTNLGSLGTYSRAMGINDSGQIVGDSFTPFGTHATLWSNGTITDLNPNNSVQTWGLGINNNGVITGNLNNGYGLERAFLLSNGTLSYLNNPTVFSDMSTYATAINDLEQVVGYANSGKATLWDGPSVKDLNGNQYTQAFDINNSGQVVGSYQSGSVSYATLWDGTSTTNLSSLAGFYSSRANSINNIGQIVGSSGSTYSSNYNADGLATLWFNGTTVDLNTLLSASDVSAGWVLKDARGINDKGSIIGQASNSLLGIESQAFLLQSVTPVPEADTTAMLLTGLGVIGFMVRRKNTQA